MPLLGLDLGQMIKDGIYSVVDKTLEGLSTPLIFDQSISQLASKVGVVAGVILLLVGGCLSTCAVTASVTSLVLLTSGVIVTPVSILACVMAWQLQKMYDDERLARAYMQAGQEIQKGTSQLKAGTNALGEAVIGFCQERAALTQEVNRVGDQTDHLGDATETVKEVVADIANSNKLANEIADKAHEASERFQQSEADRLKVAELQTKNIQALEELEAKLIESAPALPSNDSELGELQAKITRIEQAIEAENDPDKKEQLEDEYFKVSEHLAAYLASKTT